MCFMTLISTTDNQDLSKLNTSLVNFSKDLPCKAGEDYLKYPHKWLMGSRHGCSCGFRHLSPVHKDLWFSEPVDWWPEEQEDIEATLEMVSIFKSLLSRGAKLDCFDAWLENEKEPELDDDIIVNLSIISASQFRLFDGYRFEIKNEA